MIHIVLSLIISFLSNPIQKSPDWKSFNDALKLAEKENRPLLINFYTDWCTFCKKLDKEVYADQEVIKYLNTHFIVSKVNAEDENGTANYKEYSLSYPQLTHAFGISGFPATVFMNAKAEYITRLPGYVPKDVMMIVLTYIAEKHYEKEAFADFYERKKPKE